MNKSDKKEQMLDLDNRLNRIIEWVKTCDNKATTLLSITALILTILLAGDYIMTGMQTILSTAFDSNCTEPSVSGILAVVCFALAIGLLLASLICCILVVRAKPNEDLDKDPSVKKDSLIHFNHISELSYPQFKESLNEESEDVFLEDLKSQIHINAVRCAGKFKTFNIALWLLCGAIPVALVYIAFTVIFLAQL